MSPLGSLVGGYGGGTVATEIASGGVVVVLCCYWIGKHALDTRRTTEIPVVGVMQLGGASAARTLHAQHMHTHTHARTDLLC